MVFLPRGKVFRSALDDALAQNRISAQLDMALDDRAVAAAHTYELAVVAIIAILMATKPF